MKDDQHYLVTQSAASNIRFWLMDELTPEAIQPTIAKEISRAYLLDYFEGNAIWAQKDFITGTMLNIYIGFDFSKLESLPRLPGQEELTLKVRSPYRLRFESDSIKVVSHELAGHEGYYLYTLRLRRIPGMKEAQLNFSPQT